MIDLEFNHVSKKYMVQADDARADSGTGSFWSKLTQLRRVTKPFWAVRDVSFQIKRGESFGIIGHNGAGKSTILKLLSNITAPSAGEITINGRLSALIEVGSGFHPELTGRENTYLSGSILGMRRREIAAKLDSIVEFAGVRQFLDTPVKRYSSGMYVRLGFAIAAHLEPDILLLDEVLAVGDAAFQEKCLQRIKELEDSGTTIVFISHDLVAVERLCQRVILMRAGEVAAEGTPSDVIKVYRGIEEEEAAAEEVEAAAFIVPIALPPRTSHQEWDDLDSAPGDEVVRLRSARVRTLEGDDCEVYNIRLPIGLEATYDVLENGHLLIPNFHLVNQDGVYLFSLQDVQTEWRRKPRAPGRYVSTVWIPGNFLAEGSISVHVGIGSHLPIDRTHAFCLDVIAFQVVDRFDGDTARGDYTGDMRGAIRPSLNWTTHFRADAEVSAMRPSALSQS